MTRPSKGVKPIDVSTDFPAGVTLDTINFGFDEARIGRDQVRKLDRLAGALERIIRRNPEEVFLLEGHTDAVGSDGYNLDLSMLRADAVKEALVDEYGIPARNLETEGYGEDYLKVPTQEPEWLNRRVTVRRITPLLSEQAN